MQHIELVRARQQAAMDAAALKYKEEKKKKDELLAKQREEDWNLQKSGQSYRSKAKNQEDDFEALGLTRPNKNATSRPRLKRDGKFLLKGNLSSSSSSVWFTGVAALLFIHQFFLFEDYNPLTGQSYNQTDRQSFRREQPRRGGWG